MADENPIYLRLGYDESVEAKKEILSSEISFLNIMKIMKRYNSLRKEELGLKLQLYKSVKELNVAIRKTRSDFPFIKLPNQPKKEEPKKKEVVSIFKESFDTDIENQLQKIQDRLKSIGR